MKLDGNKHNHSILRVEGDMVIEMHPTSVGVNTLVYHGRIFRGEKNIFSADYKTDWGTARRLFLATAEAAKGGAQ